MASAPIEAYPVEESHASNFNEFEHVEPNKEDAISFLMLRSWPKGLQNTFIENLNKIPLRYFICDDSGSMITNDGKRVTNVNGKTR